MGYYRQIIYDWVLARTNNATSASNCVKVTLLTHLKATNVKAKGSWEPNEDCPHNKCKRGALYLAMARELGWTQRRPLLPPSAGIGNDANEDGFSDDVHTAANAMWPGDEHDLPLPLPSAANCP